MTSEMFDAKAQRCKGGKEKESRERQPSDMFFVNDTPLYLLTQTSISNWGVAF